ncbi:MAG: choice-of-anchor tandem repeat GloVer-containing protein, partial [Terriglobales bacterium]
VGTVFQIDSALVFSSLHSFDGADGDYPNVSLVQGANGNLYGATVEGGASGGTGTFYEMTTSGGFTTQQTFKPAQVAGANGALIQGNNGNFYGTDTGGGNGAGTIYEVTPEGEVSVLYTFCSKTDCTDGSTPYGALIIGSDGNFYGVTYAGGANITECNAGCGTLFKITPAGKLTTLYSFCSQAKCADGSQPEGGLLQDTNGIFYGTTYSGGTNGLGTIYSISTATTQTPFVKTLPTSAKTGTTIIIMGNNLTGATQVLFNGIAAAFTVISSTEIEAIVPAGATTGPVTVVTPSGTLKTIVIFYVDVTPQIKNFTPKSGPVGTKVTITGVGLTQTTAVTFGGVAAGDFTVVSDKKVTATVPADATTGKIAITTPGGTATSTASFTVTE